jgi:hypothetical protein
MAGRPLLARFAPYEVAIALTGLAAALLALFALAAGEVRFITIVLAAAAALATSAFTGLDTTALIEAGVVAILALILLGRPGGFAGVWAGNLILALVLALVLQVLAPTTAYVVAWPLFAAAVIAHLVAPTQKVLAPIRWIAALALMVIGAGWAGGMIHSLLQALDIPELPAAPVWLAALLLWPLLWPRRGSRGGFAALAAGALAIGAAIGVWLHFTNPWSARHPDASELLLVTDAASGNSWRASPLPPNAWTNDALIADGGRIERLSAPTFRHPLWVVPVAGVPLAGPTITIDRSSDGALIVRATIEAGQTLHLDLTSDAVVTSSAINGRPAPLLGRPGKPSHLVWQGGPLTVSLHPLGHGALDLAYALYTPAWPAAAKPLPRLPRDVMAWDMAGSSVAVGAMRTTW